ncbi:MAG: ATP-dependent DNA helicase RecG [Xanthomonadaceae bacterium]|nr:ATP-dependent DNA helicase RecG [Xanthomonadaceae bacterium]
MRESTAAQPVTALPGVGQALAKTLERLGLRTLQDLWFHLPLRYEDRTRITPIRDLQPGAAAQVEGRIEAVERGFRYRPQLRVAIGDDSRATLLLRFFHFNAAQANQLVVGTLLRCYGEPRLGAQGLEMVHPQYRRVADTAAAAVEERLTPVYPVTEGLSSARLAGVIARALQRLPADAELELIPPDLRKAYRLASLRDALLFAHRPPPDADLAQLELGLHPTQQRLAFEELMAQHLSLKRLRARVRQHAAPALRGGGELRRRFLAALPFAPTHAQQRVAAEVAHDLAKPAPMLRLVQGDVGSGKTVVAALAALAAVEAGFQAALMAPTELLAEQHFRNFQRWMQPLGVEVVWLAGKLKGKSRSAALAHIAGSAEAHPAQIVIGTHALMQEGVAFHDLALAIIDEQHRFGVHQRLALREKGRVAQAAPRGRGMEAELEGSAMEGRLEDRVPHQLVLTATPIPRTLAMTAYADLDVSIIDELPPGRRPVTTVAIANARRHEVIERIRAACADGRQAYWVCTIIEESDLLQAQAAEAAYAELTSALPGLAIGLVHGRLKPAQKQAVMDAFAAGKIALLVATTVIEVGVDVPNASLMIVENAERLGLAQLHQLRGRVGRGNVESSCVLLYQAPLSAMARQRLDVLRVSNDGFRIAEKDLELRGPGEVLGTRQTGELALRIADLARDAALLPQVQRAGATVLDQSPALADKLIERWIGQATRYAGA